MAYQRRWAGRDNDWNWKDSNLVPTIIILLLVVLFIFATLLSKQESSAGYNHAKVMRDGYFSVTQAP